jgi:DNA polymerase
LARALATYVEYQRELGVLGFAPAAPRPAATSAPRPAPPAPPPAGAPPRIQAPTSDLFVSPGLAAAATLEALRAHIGDCRRCKLAPHRTNLVFGVGNPAARLVFVGEGPGHDEDLKGEPFVGRAGQLLTEIITKGMKLQRADVYIANVVKCRPPGNRDPQPDEIAACRSYLERQIALVRPRVIVALGRVAAQTLLGNDAPIGRMRGQWFRVQGVPTMVTYHPAALLRNSALKRPTWEDMQQVRDLLRSGQSAGA